MAVAFVVVMLLADLSVSSVPSLGFCCAGVYSGHVAGNSGSEDDGTLQLGVSGGATRGVVSSACALSRFFFRKPLLVAVTWLLGRIRSQTDGGFQSKKPRSREASCATSTRRRTTNEARQEHLIVLVACSCMPFVCTRSRALARPTAAGQVSPGCAILIFPPGLLSAAADPPFQTRRWRPSSRPCNRHRQSHTPHAVAPTCGVQAHSTHGQRGRGKMRAQSRDRRDLSRDSSNHRELQHAETNVCWHIWSTS
jgi:hypothetical protein